VTPSDATGMEHEEREALAGEYVLVTLDAAERRAAEARIAADPAFAIAVAAWQKRLQPLADAAPPVDLPPRLWSRIESGIEALATPDRQNNVVALRRSVRRWRLAAAACAAAAAVLVAVVAVDRLQPPLQPAFVAVLTAPDGTTPAFLATVDVGSRTIELVRVASPAPPGKSYELWSILPDQPPHSLGVVEKASLRRAIDSAPAADVTLAITLERKGGSPTGAPQGPLVFKGTLLPAQ
jgi:anti-sigma-K factor RskA